MNETKKFKCISLISLGVMISLIIIMIIKISIAISIHLQHPEWSAPAYVEIVNGVYYIIPIIASLTVNVIYKKKARLKKINR
jgi:hypothetical protein